MSRTVKADGSHFVAAAGAWLVPGLGHWLLGERRRAAVIGPAIALLWFLGILIGGIGVIDAKRNQWWFLGQMLTAPSILVDQARQRITVERTDPHDVQPLSYVPPLGRTAEQGVLFTALAGMLNLLAILDVMHRPLHDHAPAARLFGERS